MGDHSDRQATRPTSYACMQLQGRQLPPLDKAPELVGSLHAHKVREQCSQASRCGVF